MTNKIEEFPPYKMYLDNTQRVTEFEELSEISFNLSQQLLFKYSKEDLPKIDHSDKDELFKSISYSMADFKVMDTSETRWLTKSQYAEKTKFSIKKIEKLLTKGELGTTYLDPETKETLIIWPQSFNKRDINDLPKPGKVKFKVVVEINASADMNENVEDMDNFEVIQKKFLSLAHSIGKPEDVNKNAKNTLYRSCFILQWTCFEVYLRSLLDEVIKQNPEILFDDKQAEKLFLSYKELFNYSKKFESITSLQSRIIENEIAKQEGENKSVHGIINFLKCKFKFNKDPYVGWYNIRGVRKETCYNDLIEHKEVRNSLMHDSGFPDSSFFSDYPNVPTANGEIIINLDYYLKAKLTMRSIAYNLTNLIVMKEYSTNNR